MRVPCVWPTKRPSYRAESTPSAHRSIASPQAAVGSSWSTPRSACENSSSTLSARAPVGAQAGSRTTRVSAGDATRPRCSTRAAGDACRACAASIPSPGTRRSRRRRASRRFARRRAPASSRRVRRRGPPGCRTDRRPERDRPTERTGEPSLRPSPMPARPSARSARPCTRPGRARTRERRRGNARPSDGTVRDEDDGRVSGRRAPRAALNSLSGSARGSAP